MKRKLTTRFGAVTALIMIAASGISTAQQGVRPDARKAATEGGEKPKAEGSPKSAVVTPPPPAPPSPPAPPEAARPSPAAPQPTQNKGETLKPAPKAPGGNTDEKGMPPVENTESNEAPGHHIKPKLSDMNEPVAPTKEPAKDKVADPRKLPQAKPDPGPTGDSGAAIKQKFDAIEGKEVSFEEFQKSEIEEAARLEQLRLRPNTRFTPAPTAKSLQTACGNGDFESGLDLSQWSGGYGSIGGNGMIDYPNFTAGISQGAINLGTSRQTLTNQGADPIVGIPQTGPAAPNYTSPTRSQHAVRIGNTVTGRGAELLSKSFIVTPNDANLRFWYAVVMENPGHSAAEQPNFEVRVLDNNGAPIPGLVDLGNGSGKIIASADPFLQQKAGGSVVFRDWSCVQVNLSSQVGQRVTMQFVTRDCSQGGHWGYAYIDNICGKCGMDNPTGDIRLNAAQSSKCGAGKLCFDLTLGKDTKGVTGTAVVNIDIYQNGSKVTTLTSPVISSGTSYCFPIDPATITGLNAALGGFDYTATGKFTVGSSVTTLTVGNPPSGQAGVNNDDYKIACEPCCDGKNLVANGEMDTTAKMPDSTYKPIRLSVREKLLPGTIALSDAGAIREACSNWKMPDACLKTKDFSGGVMLVNGLTNQPSGQASAIIDQKVPLSGRLKNTEYSICFRYLPLPACCFDVAPKLNVVVKGANGAAITLTNVKDVATGCGQFYSAKFIAAPGAVNLQILLAEDGRGDGNDLVIDNVAVRECSPGPIGPRDAIDPGAIRKLQEP